MHEEDQKINVEHKSDAVTIFGRDFNGTPFQLVLSEDELGQLAQDLKF